MSDLLSYEIWHTAICDPPATDSDGLQLAPGWYYQFPEAEPVGPFTTSGRAEFCAEAEIEEYESALATETY